MKPFLTIFTATKAFTNPHINIIQRNALHSWQALGPEVEVLVMGREEGQADVCREFGIRHVEVAHSPEGTPLLDDMFCKAQELTASQVFAVFNADVITLPDFLDTSHILFELGKPFVAFSTRYDLDVTQELDFNPGWDERIWQMVKEKGTLHPPVGSDYFLFRRGMLLDIPPFTIGRSGWDNWMIFNSRQKGWLTVNTSGQINIVHQNHDYSHLPGNKPPYRLPETLRNVKMAGGRRVIFMISDCSHRMKDGKLTPPERGWKRFWREVEIFPLVKLRSKALGNLIFAIFHPVKAFDEARYWLYKKIKGIKD